MEEQQQKQHFESWETFWGRPGNGAPRDSSQKENLMKMLHYPADTVKHVSADDQDDDRNMIIETRTPIFVWN